MELADALAATVLATLVAYALLGGADFGGGAWDLLAFGPRAAAQRATIAAAIGPIWEANHVWLIAAIVLLFAGFAPAFAEIMTQLHIPVTLLLIGIVARGTSFVFRTYDVDDDRVQRRWSLVFSISSVVAPLLLGVLVGALSVAPPEAVAPTSGAGSFAGRYLDPWLHPFPLAVGLLALVQFAHLAAVYLTLETDDPALRDDFRGRALVSGLALAAVAGGTLLLGRVAAPAFVAALLGRPWSGPLIVGATALAVVSLVSLWRRRFALARLCAAGQVVALLVGWGCALHPDLMAGRLTIEQAAAPPRVLRSLLVAFASGSVVLIPALVYLLRTFKGRALRREALASDMHSEEA